MNKLKYRLINNDTEYEVIHGDYSGLTNVTIPRTHLGKKVTSIGDWAFYSCTSLTSIIIPNSVVSIGNWAFTYCISLTNIIIPNSITSIGYEAFSWCENLTEITIPNSVISIGYRAFSDCRSLTTINHYGKRVVKCIDRYCMEILSQFDKGEYTFYSCRYFETQEKCRISQKSYNGNIYSAHAKTFKKAIEDINFKIAREKYDMNALADSIKEKNNNINTYDYRLITGACESGSEEWKKGKGIEVEASFDITEFYEKYKNEEPYGWEYFVEFYEDYFGKRNIR